MAMHEYQKQTYKKVGVILALVLLPIAGFFAGTQYQKQTTPTANNGKAAQFGNGPHMLKDHAIGTVKSISDTSITLTERMNNQDKTYTLTSSTTYKNGTSEAQVSDIKTGDTVMLTLDSSDNAKVAAIILNPTTVFNGGEGSGSSTGGDAVLE